MEICVENLASAVAAAEGGASRIELCSALSEGGLTPSVGLLKIVKEAVNIPVFCMLRPRAGNFTYSPEEIRAIEIDAKILLEAGADGVVFGVLTERGCVDMAACKKIISKLPTGTQMTFHRAFDWTHDPAEALGDIIELGFQRILTSGCAKTALDGIDLLKMLIIEAGNRISIMPGAGINSSNLSEIWNKIGNLGEGLGATEFHASVSNMKKILVHHNPMCNMGSQDNEMRTTDANAVAVMVHMIKEFMMCKNIC